MRTRIGTAAMLLALLVTADAAMAQETKTRNTKATGAQPAAKAPTQITNKQRRSEGKAVLPIVAEPPHVGPERDEKVRGDLPVLRDARVPDDRFIERDQLYKRKLAMYEGGTRYDRALPRFDESGERSVKRVHSTRRPRREKEEKERSQLPLIIGLAFLSVSGCAYGFMKWREQTKR